MKAKIAALAAAVLAAAVLVAVHAPAALNAYRTGITLPQAVKLGDGSVLPAGRYDVEIEYRGFGNTAEFHFFQGGVLKGKTPAEARGFPSQAPVVQGGNQADYVPKGGDAAQKGVKLDTADQKVIKQDAAKKYDSAEKVRGDGASPQASFSWGSHGFNPGALGKTSPQGQGIRLSFDSANGPAGFSALLPAVKK